MTPQSTSSAAVPLDPPPAGTVVPDFSPDMLSALLRAVGDSRDKKAFSTLFGFFAPRLKSFFLRGGASETMAEEMMQETLLLVWRKAALFNHAIAGASTWIYAIARNQRIDHLRKERRFTQIDAYMLNADEVEEHKGEDEVYATQSEALLSGAMRDLPAEQVEVLRLSFFENHSHSEIAQKLKLPIGTVKSRLRLAFGKLRNSLEGILE